MLQVQGTNISIIRGDTGTIDINISVNGVPYQILDTDKIVFSVKKYYDTDAYAIQKTAESGKIKLLHTDTNELSTGNYVWDMQITTTNGDVATIGPGKLNVLPDVTRE